MFRRKEPEPDPVLVACQKEARRARVRGAASHAARCAQKSNAAAALRLRGAAPRLRAARLRTTRLCCRCAAAARAARRRASPPSPPTRLRRRTLRLRAPGPCAAPDAPRPPRPPRPPRARPGSAPPAAQNARLAKDLGELERHYALKDQELRLLQDGQDMLQQQLRVR